MKTKISLTLALVFGLSSSVFAVQTQAVLGYPQGAAPTTCEMKTSLYLFKSFLRQAPGPLSNTLIFENVLTYSITGDLAFTKASALAVAPALLYRNATRETNQNAFLTGAPAGAFKYSVRSYLLGQESKRMAIKGAEGAFNVFFYEALRPYLGAAIEGGNPLEFFAISALIEAGSTYVGNLLTGAVDVVSTQGVRALSTSLLNNALMVTLYKGNTYDPSLFTVPFFITLYAYTLNGSALTNYFNGIAEKIISVLPEDDGICAPMDEL